MDQDADLNLAVERCVMGSFAYAGQICISVQRIYVHKKIYDKFKKEFLEKTSKLKLGDPLDKDTDVGPMITEDEAKRTESWVNDAVKEGARILIGGKRDGVFYYPTVLENVKPEMKVMSLEVFAPVVSLIPFEDFSDAVKMVDEFDIRASGWRVHGKYRKCLSGDKRDKSGGNNGERCAHLQGGQYALRRGKGKRDRKRRA